MKLLHCLPPLSYSDSTCLVLSFHIISFHYIQRFIPSITDSPLLPLLSPLHSSLSSPPSTPPSPHFLHLIAFLYPPLLFLFSPLFRLSTLQSIPLLISFCGCCCACQPSMIGALKVLQDMEAAHCPPNKGPYPVELLLLFVCYHFPHTSDTRPCQLVMAIFILILLTIHFSSACSIIFSPTDSYGGGRQSWGVLGHH